MLRTMQLANSIMTISEAFRRCGYSMPEVHGTSAKLYCPWGMYHFDGGTSRALRIYPESNSSYCFACSERLDPVGVYRKAHDLSRAEAVRRILDDAGYTPPSAEEVWNSAMSYAPPVDREALRETLRLYLTDLDPNFEDRSLGGEVGHYYSAVLRLLPSVQTDDQAVTWLRIAKDGMAKILETSS